MYLSQDPTGTERVMEAAQAARQGLIQQAGEFPIKVLIGSLVWFGAIYFFLIRRR